MLHKVRALLKETNKIELVVAFGILALVGLAIIRLFTGSAAQKNWRVANDSRLATYEIATILSDKNACLKTMGGMNPAIGAIVPTIKDAWNMVRYSTNSLNKSGSLSLVSAVIGGPGVDPRSGLPKFQRTTAVNGPALLMLNWEPTQLASNEPFSRFVVLYLTVDKKNRIIDCWASIPR